MTPTIYPAVPQADELSQGRRARLDLVVKMLELAQDPDDELQPIYLIVALQNALELRDAIGPAKPTPRRHRPDRTNRVSGLGAIRPAAGAPAHRAERPPTGG